MLNSHVSINAENLRNKEHPSFRRSKASFKDKFKTLID